MPTARDEDFRSIADLRGWISSQLRVLTRFWYVTLGVVAVTSVALYVALIPTDRSTLPKNSLSP